MGSTNFMVTSSAPGITSIFLHKNICFDPSLDPPHQEGSNEGSQHMFLLRNKKNYL